MGRGFESLLRYHIVARSCEAPGGSRSDRPRQLPVRLLTARDPDARERPRVSAPARSALGVGAQEPVPPPSPPGPAEVPPERPPPPEEVPPVPPAEAPPREDPPEIQPPPDIPPSTPPDEIPEPPPQTVRRVPGHAVALVALPGRRPAVADGGNARPNRLALVLADRSQQWVAETGGPRYYIRLIAGT
jgi:hypothetical protein